MLKNTVIANQRSLERIKKQISKQGKNKFHVIADFDRTLTKAFVNGEKIPSVISILRNGDYLTSDYAKKATALADKYHTIEINPEIPIEEKKKAMKEWWTLHFDLLIKSKLNKKDLEKVVDTGRIKLREGTKEFIDFLNKNNIPLVIMSSSGLGGDSISVYLKKEGILHNNIHIISNSYEWNEKGDAISIKKPIIHCMNKSETTIQNFPVFKIIKDRKNVLLLGDSLGDIGMVEGFNYDNLIKIGFLNENIEGNLEQYKDAYDVIILNDSSMEYINQLLRQIF